jgi:hypothetical protein
MDRHAGMELNCLVNVMPKRIMNEQETLAYLRAREAAKTRSFSTSKHAEIRKKRAVKRTAPKPRWDTNVYWQGKKVK